MGKPREKGDDVVRGEGFRRRGTKSWTPSHWGAYARGYQSGQASGRQDGLELAHVPPRADRFLRQAEAAKLAGIGRTSLWKLERAGDFPQRVKPLGARSRAVRYCLSEVIAWHQRRQAARKA